MKYYLLNDLSRDQDNVVEFTKQELEFIKNHIHWDAGMNLAKANAYENITNSIKNKIERILK